MNNKDAIKALLDDFDQAMFDLREGEPVRNPEYQHEKQEIFTEAKSAIDHLIRQAKIEELNKLSYHQATTLNGTEDIQITLDYIADRISEIRGEHNATNN